MGAEAAGFHVPGTAVLRLLAAWEAAGRPVPSSREWQLGVGERDGGPAAPFGHWARTLSAGRGGAEDEAWEDGGGGGCGWHAQAPPVPIRWASFSPGAALGPGASPTTSLRARVAALAGPEDCRELHRPQPEQRHRLVPGSHSGLLCCPFTLCLVGTTETRASEWDASGGC